MKSTSDSIRLVLAGCCFAFFVAGCSTTPIADIMDHFSPGTLGTEKTPPYGGVCPPSGLPGVQAPPPVAPVLGPPPPPPGAGVPPPAFPQQTPAPPPGAGVPPPAFPQQTPAPPVAPGVGMSRGASIFALPPIAGPDPAGNR